MPGARPAATTRAWTLGWVIRSATQTMMATSTSATIALLSQPAQHQAVEPRRIGGIAGVDRAHDAMADAEGDVGRED